MKIPDKIQIVGRAIKIKIDPNLIKKTNAEGQAYPFANKIILAPVGPYNDGSKKKMLRVNQEVALLHELLHIIAEVLQIQLSESKTNTLAEIWYQVNCQLYKQKRR